MNSSPFDFTCLREPLAPHTLYRIGGPAEIALFPSTLREAQAAYDWARSQQKPLLLLGGGSNVLVSDAGFPGIVLFTTGLKWIEMEGERRYCVGAGVMLADLVTQVMLRNNYAGVGALAGIPGTVGGALFMNAGTVNGSACDFVERICLLTPSGLREIDITADSFGYRAQSFCAVDDLIAQGTFAFQESGKDEREVFDHYIHRRRNTQPQGHCCGSVFKNPAGARAGRLIEACGLKGTRLGGAVISEKHANFIMNEGGASFADVHGLIQLVKDRVRERFGILLEEEVRIIMPENCPSR